MNQCPTFVIRTTAKENRYATIGVGAIRWDKFVPENYPVMVFDSAGTRQENDPVREGSELIEDLFWLKLKDK